MQGSETIRWLTIAGLVVVALIVAAVSVPLLLLLVAGGALGWLLTALPSMRPQQRRAVSVAGLGVLVLGAGLLLWNQLRAPSNVRADGPFSTAYRQSVTLREDVAEVEERYVIEADSTVTVTRIVVEGEGTIQMDDDSVVEGMTIIPTSNSVAFTVSRPPTTLDRASLGFRFWETTIPLLRTTVFFDRPEDDREHRWPVVRCLNLDIQMVLEVAGGRLVGASPEPERIEVNEAEWRSLDDFDPTDFSPQVEVQVDQVPGILGAMHSGVRSIGSKFTDSIVTLLIGGVITSTTTTVQKQLKRRKPLAPDEIEAKPEEAA